jgi:hypothetical protein
MVRFIGARTSLVVAVVLAISGCAAASDPSPLGKVAGIGGGCYPAPAAAGGPLPFSLGDVSAAPGTDQAWILGGTPTGPGPYKRQYLLHVNGLTWTKELTFPRDEHPTGVSAIFGNSVWIWGYEGRYLDDSRKDKPFIDMLSVDGIDDDSAPFLSRVFVTDLAADGDDDAWLAGRSYSVTGQDQGLVVARWDGTTWHRVQLPAQVAAVEGLSDSGPSNAWAVASRGFGVGQWLLHWNGVAWSTSYTPPSGLATHGRVPQDLTVTSSGGHGWATFTEAGTDSGSNPRPGPEARTMSAYYNGRTWRTISLPAIARPYGLAEVTMGGGDAWAITKSRNIDAVMYSHQGGYWCAQNLPHQHHPACLPTSISAASPDYVLADTAFSSAPCRSSYAFVYDGQRWRPLKGSPPPRSSR